MISCVPKTCSQEKVGARHVPVGARLPRGRSGQGGRAGRLGRRGAPRRGAPRGAPQRARCQKMVGKSEYSSLGSFGGWFWAVATFDLSDYFAIAEFGGVNLIFIGFYYLYVMRTS